MAQFMSRCFCYLNFPYCQSGCGSTRGCSRSFKEVMYQSFKKTDLGLFVYCHKKVWSLKELVFFEIISKHLKKEYPLSSGSYLRLI